MERRHNLDLLMTADPRFRQPWRLQPHRVHRFYRGGKLLEEFRGVSPDEARDSDTPEDWVGSATPAWTPPGAAATDDGLSTAEAAGRTFRVADALDADPVAVAGTTIVERFGATTGVLVKLLDAAVRLPVHCHPSREFARRHLGSQFGKAEAWIILATRSRPSDAQPTVRIGFRRDVGRDELIDWIEQGRTEDLLEAMHERPTGVGDVWFVPPGVPHAIGAGIFMLEVEEPSDFSIVAETRDVPIRPADAQLGLGWDVTIDAFDRTGHDDPWIDDLRTTTGGAAPVATDVSSGGRSDLTGSRTRDFFTAQRLVLERGTSSLSEHESFVVGVVTAGSGQVRTTGGRLALRAGDTFAVPAASSREAVVDADGRIELICCLPPTDGERRTMTDQRSG